jgi:Rho-binding antiterminator
LPDASRGRFDVSRAVESAACRASLTPTHSEAMTTHPSTYRPISCEFHDLLEDHATTRRAMQIRFRDAEGADQLRRAVIIDVYARAGAEYLSTSTGEVVRLDHLVDVDGVRLADY